MKTGLVDAVKNIAKRLGINRADVNLKWFNFTRRMRVNGVTVRIPSINGVACHSTEPWMSGLLSSVLKRQAGTFLDVGVNLGQTLVKVKTIDPDRDYVGLEPNPVCNAYLQELVGKNNFRNCKLLPVGLFSQNLIMRLDIFTDYKACSAASVIQDYRPGQKVFSHMYVPVFSFDSIENSLEDHKIGAVKIDVEGAELEVLESMQRVLKNDRPILIIEILPASTDGTGARLGRQKKIEELFLNAGYTTFRVGKTKKGEFDSLVQVTDFGIHQDYTWCDYLIVPNEQAGIWR